MLKFRRSVAVVTAIVSLALAAQASEPVSLIVGNVPSLTGAPLYIAKEKGYYAAAGLDVRIEFPGSPSDMAAMLSTDRLQVIGAGFSAGFLQPGRKRNYPSPSSCRAR
jgi:ABC-type nitrate/sulfonate/bicarbonate transport systems, periplasmic components